MGRVTSLVALGPRCWPFVLRVAATAAAVELAVRTLPLPAVSRFAGVPLAVGPERPGDAWAAIPDRDRRRAELALRVLRGRPFRATCLRRALVLGVLLRRHHPALRVGVAKAAGTVAAHAWLEVDGVSLDAESAAYRPLPLGNGRAAPGLPGLAAAA